MTKKTKENTEAKKNTKTTQQKNKQGEKKAENNDVKTEKKAEKEEKVEKKYEKTDAEKLEELNDRYLRLAAEYDNYRKRTLKERMELTKTAGEDILVNILPVMDDFERALNSIDQSKAVGPGRTPGGVR